MNKGKSILPRTDWAEFEMEFLLSPLVSEFVFRSPKKQNQRKIQREVADFLISLDGTSLLISQKCQDNPLNKSEDKALSWGRKKAKEAVAQLNGALRTSDEPFWCDHARRGRVDFSRLPKINHAIVTIEVMQNVDLNPESAFLPLHYQNTPISYFSVNDFSNVAQRLRTIRELTEYLDSRQGLSSQDRLIIGDERCLLEHYFLERSFENFKSRSQAKSNAHSRRRELSERISANLQLEKDCLPLSRALNQRFEASAPRTIEAMCHIANLTLADQARIGRALSEVEKLKNTPLAATAVSALRLQTGCIYCPRLKNQIGSFWKTSLQL